MERVLIIGGGIAGPVAAIALQRAGFSALVCEAHPGGADEVGSWLTLQANGVDALAAVDAHHLLAGIGFPTRTIRFVNGRGRVLGTMSNGAPLPNGTGSHMVRRADLYRALRDEATARGAQVRYAARLHDAQPRPDGGVHAVFADGSTERADLLLGADGIRSTVRPLIDPAAPAARFVPLLNLGDYVPDLPLALDRPVEEFQMMFGTRLFVGITPAPDGGAVWFANPPHRQEPAPGELAAVTDADWRTRLTGLLAHDTGPVADAVRRAIAATPGPLSAWPTYDLPTVPTWHRGPMAIIGDAAHATAPSAGQGAALALEDAVLIAKFLRDAPDATTAFTAFEQARRARVEKVVAYGNRSSNTKAAGPLGRVVRDAVLPLVFKQASKNDSASTRWITDHHIDWNAPQHPTSGEPPERAREGHRGPSPVNRDCPRSVDSSFGRRLGTPCPMGRSPSPGTWRAQPGLYRAPVPYPPRPQLRPLPEFRGTASPRPDPAVQARVETFIVEQYEAGRSLRQLAELTDRSFSAVPNILTRHSVHRRSSGAALLPESGR